MVDQRNSDSGTVEQIWWSTRAMMVEQWNSRRMMVKQWNRGGGTVE